jgi:hypothetical protein
LDPQAVVLDVSVVEIKCVYIRDAPGAIDRPVGLDGLGLAFVLVFHKKTIFRAANALHRDPGFQVDADPFALGPQRGEGVGLNIWQ